MTHSPYWDRAHLVALHLLFGFGQWWEDEKRKQEQPMKRQAPRAIKKTGH